MKFTITVALATFAAVSVATGAKEKDCSDLGAKVPACSAPCVNDVAKKYCESGDYACSCSEEIFAKIVDESAECVAAACAGEGSVFEPLEAYCACELGNVKPTTTATPQPTETAAPNCDAENKAIPTCAVDCLNSEAYKQCPDGDADCVCKSGTLKDIVKDSAKCVKEACDGKVEVFKPLKDWCKCTVGEEPAPTTSAEPTKTASEEPTDTATTSEEPTETATTSDEPTDTATAEPTTSKPATLTSTYYTTTIHTVTSCHNRTACATGRATQTLTMTTTWCPDETSGPVPTGPGPESSIYPTTPGSPGTTYIPTSTAKPPKPTFEAAGVMTQQSSGFVAIVAIVAGLAWL